MNDRYLFRAKRTDNGKWVEGFPSYDEFGEIGEIEEYNKTSSVFHYIDPSTICQCTGLKDKNGKLIWENDIVKRKFRLFSGEAKYEEKENCGVVKYDESYARFGYQCSVFAMLRESEKYDSLEVIGNISDNPELLEVGE
ncbi:MAG: YopX family protein [Clostridiales bacterium]|nr:YopX family protein [Clostridiales bacterium]MDY4113124.1 YopX family protein [Roseburia sp.]